MTSASDLPWHRRLLYGLTNWGLFFAGAVNLAVGTISAYNGQATIATTSLTAGLILLFAATVDRFESLKGLGIEAKTRQLDQKIEQADEALRRVKELAEVTGASLIDLNSKMGRWDSAPSPREAYALAQKVRGIMGSLGSNPLSLREALKPWVRTMLHDLATTVTTPLELHISERMLQLERERATIQQPMDPNDPILLRTSMALRDGNTYLEQRLRKVHKFEIDDFPDRFLNLFEDVPLVEPDVLAPIQATAQRFAPAMIELRERLQLSDPESALSVIEDRRKRT